MARPTAKTQENREAPPQADRLRLQGARRLQTQPSTEERDTLRKAKPAKALECTYSLKSGLIRDAGYSSSFEPACPSSFRSVSFGNAASSSTTWSQ